MLPWLMRSQGCDWRFCTLQGFDVPVPASYVTVVPEDSQDGESLRQTSICHQLPLVITKHGCPACYAHCNS